MSTYSWIGFLTFIGSIGLYLYGMKLMSEGLQKIAGDRLRSMLATMTGNRATNSLAGMLVTTLVQSSSAMIVMIVSFVNAELFSLAESMSFIMGANVGTTMTTWLIAVCGFKFDISIYILPLIAIALPWFNSTHSKRNTWGEFIIGFALLFLGIEIMKHSAPDLNNYPALFGFMQEIGTLGYLSILLALLFGILLTMMVQASNAAFPIIALMSINGWIPFEMGCAMILGSNIGTCIPPLVTSLQASTMAKRAAVGHLLFNVIGVLWVMALFYPCCRFITWLCITLGIGDPQENDNICLGLTMFHTAFNLANLLVLIGFTRQLVKIVTRMTPEKESPENEAFTPKYLDQQFIASGEIALLQARKEVTRYADEDYRMFELIRTMFKEPLASERQLELFLTVQELEDQSDRAEIEIADFMNKIDLKSLSYDSEMLSRRLYKMVDELESIADCIYQMACTLKRKSDERIYFTAQQNKDIQKMIDLTDTALSHMIKCMEKEELSESAMIKAYNCEDEINNFRTMLRNQLLEQAQTNKDHYQQSTYYMDLISECERTGDFVINVMTAMNN